MALSNTRPAAMATTRTYSGGGSPGVASVQTPGWTPPQTGGGFQFPGMPPNLPAPPGGSLPGAPGSMPGTGGGFGAAPPGGPPGSGGLTNNVDPSANLQWLQDQYKQRLGQDPTQRAMNRATSQIRDATTGLGKELGGNMARRGIAQSGIQTSGQQALANQAQQKIAGASADIAMGRERDIDNMVMGGLPIMGAQDELGLRKQGLGLQQWQAQQQAELARQQLGLQAQGQAQQGQRDLWSMWSQYLSAMR